MAALPRRGRPLSQRAGWLLSRAAEASALGAVPLAVLATVPLPAWELRAGWSVLSAMATAGAVFLVNDAFDWTADAHSPGQRRRAPQVGIGVASLALGAVGSALLAVFAASRLGGLAMQASGIALLAGAVYAVWGKRSLWAGFATHAIGVTALAILASQAAAVSTPLVATMALVAWAWLGWLGRAHDDRDADTVAGLRTPATVWSLPHFFRIRSKLTWLTVGLFGAAALQRPEWWPWTAATLMRLLPVGTQGAWRPRALAVAALIGEAAVATLRD